MAEAVPLPPPPYRDGWKNSTVDLTLTSAILVISGVLYTLPFGMARQVGRFLGRIAFWILPRDRARAVAHLQDRGGLAPPAAHRLARAVFCQLGESFAELCWLPRLGTRLDTAVTVEGLEHLERASQIGRGVIWVTGHIGNWELMAIRMARYGLPVRAVATRVRYRRLDRLLIAFRSRYGVFPVLRGEQTSQSSLQHLLEQGCVVAFLVDQSLAVPGVEVPFMGYPVHSPDGFARLALRANAPILLAHVRRIGPFRHVVSIAPPLLPDTGAAWLVSTVATAQEYLEAAIRQDLSGWPWFHRRWSRRRPKDLAHG